jgi:uncharacterized membrane protein
MIGRFSRALDESHRVALISGAVHKDQFSGLFRSFSLTKSRSIKVGMKRLLCWLRRRQSDLIMIAFFGLASLLLPGLNLHPEHDPATGRKEKARVLSVDNSHIEELGLLRTGHQELEVQLLSGPMRGEIFPAENRLRAQMELDKQFAVGDTVLVAVLADALPGETLLNAQDHYRIGLSVGLFSLFGLLLLIYGGLTGCKALLSFVFSCVIIWELVVPLCLKGWDPIGVCLVAVCVLTASIIFMVAGVNRKGLTAFSGAMLGVLVSCAMAVFFTSLFNINGSVMPYSQALFYSGYEFLDLQRIYIGAIFLASSGAVMDLGMDIAAGMQEVATHRPGISRRALAASGIRIGQNVVGTMTTTLLLAYSGGYLTMMMSFMANGVSPWDFINNPYIASEFVKTIIGSFGLVLVAPATAAVGALIIPAAHKSA